MSDFAKAVNGWKQAVRIMTRVRDGLQFCLDEMKAESRHNPRAFGTNAEKAEMFARAEADLRTANMYLEATEKAEAPAET